ncbi:MAG: decaprenyl-phosphate phosphoribosyltransferase [Planctomycetota bacterium]|nr:MAG: decaprenyl-phosphate phosphoribosyltransferase [Planctomycetota bacterium]REK27723.1 MAG: decaprenyl-phosphate phosphoribosyltransferase [Planctomycetota bacterium]REK38435.1 MAG: decaprenyl-phosphate phosphoribosyltransferase [Planctomycetota bacterium]
MIGSLWKLARPQQWSKNLLCFAGVIFSGRFLELEHVVHAILVAVAFCAGSSAIYVLNDLIDRERDRQHPKKRERPLARGDVSPAAAGILGLSLAVLALWGTWQLNYETFLCLAILLVINLAYSTVLKHVVLLDVLCIASGFVLRLLAGIYAVDDQPTTWITLCTFFLAMFFGFSKRRGELQALRESEAESRPVLESYSIDYLDNLLNSAATITILCYALFTVASGKNPALILTLPLVYYGVMRYQRIISTTEAVEEPERAVFADLRILLAFVVWLATYLIIERWDPQIFASPPAAESPTSAAAPLETSPPAASPDKAPAVE